MELWKTLRDFPEYSVSDHGSVRSDRSGRILSQSQNQYGLVRVGMMRDGVQLHRSVPLLVANTFLVRDSSSPLPFDTPINLNGDRWNNRVDNLMWRPRWFAIRYNQQFAEPYRNRIHQPVVDEVTGETSRNSLDCAMKYGLLESELVYAILNRTYVWPIYRSFSVRY